MKLYVLPLLFLLCSLTHAQEYLTIVLDSEEVKTSEHSWTLVSVERMSDCTILEKVVVPLDEDKTWIASGAGGYIEDAETGMKFFVQESEIGFERGRTLLEGWNARTFKETYPPLPAGTRYVNVSSGSEYFIKSLDLSRPVSSKTPPVSNVAFFGVHIGDSCKSALRSLRESGFKEFYQVEKEGVCGGKNLYTYLYRQDDDYPVTLTLVSDSKYAVVTEAEVLYQNHVDIYETDEHLQELADEVKAAYPYRDFKETTPDYRNAARMVDMKSGPDRIFSNVTVEIFSGHYSIGDTGTRPKNDYLGFISFSVLKDGMHSDHVIRMCFSDRKVSRYIRRSYGEMRW